MRNPDKRTSDFPGLAPGETTCRSRVLDSTVILLLGAVLLAGCATERSMSRGLEEDRTRAYQAWDKSHENEEAGRPRIEGELSMADALKLALTYNKSLQAITRKKEIARGIVLESYGNILPSVSGQAEYLRLDETAAFDVGGEVISVGDENNYEVGLQVTQPLFSGGAISASWRTAKWRSLLADDQVRGAVQDTIYETAQAYYDTLLAQHLYEVNRAAVDSAQAYLRDVQIKRDQGIASNFDILRAQVDVSLFQAQMIQQQNRINTFRTRLLLAMGGSQDSEVALSDRLEFLPLKPVLKEAVRLAYQNRPDIRQAGINLRLQEEALRIARSEYWPAVNAFLGQLWANPDPHSSTTAEWGDAWTVGISANWNLFDGLGREGRANQEEARLRQREIELAGAEEQALSDVREAILNLRDAEEFIQSQALNLEWAQEALRLAESEYREGIIEAVAVTESRSALTRAEGLYYNAVYSHTVARLGLQKAMGILGPAAGEPESSAPEEVRPGIIEQFANRNPDPVGEPPEKDAANLGDER